MKRFICGVFLSLLIFANLNAQRRNASFEEYIRKYSGIAVEQMRKHNIPASITMAQGILESGAGTSTLALATNNHFGIKKGANWDGPVYEHPDDSKHDLFRVYDNVAQSYEDHSAILLKPRYRQLFDLDITDYKGWAKGLKQCGYATSPTYAERLITIIDTYELYELDKNSTAYNIPNQATDLSLNTNDNDQHNYGISNNINNTDNYLNNPSLNYNTRQFIQNNGIPCVIAKQNDTWDGLAQELGIKSKHLLKYNEADSNVPILKGTFIYLAKKSKKGPKEMKKKWHKVSPGETMYFIAQYYGIRIDRLYKMNFKTPEYIPRVGDLLKVR